MRTWILLLGCLIALAWPPPALADDEAWASLGPPGPRAVVAIAPAPDWPRGRLLLAARPESKPGESDDGDLVRSRDGGASWERLAAPARPLYALELAPSAGGDPPAFALVGSPGYAGPKRVFRSADAGGSWQEVLTTSGVQLQLSLSPDFARDGLALLAADGRLYRSRDGGASWETVEAASGQRVQQASFSPDFGRDRTLFLAVASADLDGKPSGQPDNELSLGVLISTDGGETWAAVTGPAIDGVAYRQVGSLAVSPTYALDGTLFAVARGPWTAEPYQNGTLSMPSTALFRSRDRGSSWEPIQRGGYTLAVALSPTFATDGVMLLTRGSHYVSPASATCTWLRSTDAGASWTTVKPPGSYEGCGPVRLLVSGGQLVGLGDRAGYGSWSRSLDGGVTWQPLAPPDGGAVRGLAVSPSFVDDGMLFAGTSFGGIWQLGPGAQSSGGALPCPAQAVGGFGRVWIGEPGVRPRLGCPLEPERPVRVRQRSYDDRFFKVRAYWTEDDRADWFKLSQAENYAGWGTVSKAAEPWPSEPDAVLEGAIQPFEGGLMLWLPYPDGSRAILVLARPGDTWREFPD